MITPDATFPRTAAGAGILAIGSFRMSVVSGPDEGIVFYSAGERTIIGTHELADLCLTDRTVSRFHCA